MRSSRAGRPVIVGVGQTVLRNAEPHEAKEPVALMAAALQSAAEDAAIGEAALSALQSVDVVNIMSWPYADPAGELAAHVGAKPDRAVESAPGGERPTALIDEAAARIAAGEITAAAICGAEAFRTIGKAHAQGLRLAWGKRSDQPPIDLRDIVHPQAWRHGLRAPVRVYPLFENAFRAAHGQALEAAQQESAEMWADFSAIAARNPAAWFTEPRTPEEIATPGPANRMIAFPYPKLMNPLIAVDQAAAVIVMDAERAAELGVPEERMVHLWGAAGATDRRDPLARVGYKRSPAMNATLDGALAASGLTAEAIDLYEIYSCFPCVPKMAREQLALPADKPLTVAGGLTFFGGPGNEYMLHGTVAMVEALRRGAGRHGLLYGQGEFVTKHHALTLSVEPAPQGYVPGDDGGARQAAVAAEPSPAIADTPAGEATIETYTAVWNREGEPDRGIVVGRLVAEGSRFVAYTPPDDRDAFNLLVSGEVEPVGLSGTVTEGERFNVFTPR